MSTNRVMGRIGARILTPQEELIVTGGGPIGTTTICSAPNPLRPAGDGDAGEC
jgi:hypothetical protein